MRIRRNCCLPPPLSSLHQNDTDALTTNHFPPSLLRSPEKPTVVVSRINSHIISSKGDSANEKKIDSTETESGVTEGTDFTTISNQSWCEEEKVIPLKKRRMTFERNLISDKEKKTNESDASEEELRCRRSDGRKWRCTSRRVEGYSMCAHHLEREKLSRSRGYRRHRRYNARRNQKTTITEDERKDGKRKKNIMKQVKARSINSLVRNTVPLMLPQTL